MRRLPADRSAYSPHMSESGTERVPVELTTHEVKLVISALRQFEPY
jgi:hypothetical protein